MEPDEEDREFSEKEGHDHAAELIAVMSKALEGALDASTRPALALAGLHMAMCGLRGVIGKTGNSTEKEMEAILEWADSVISSDPNQSVVAIAATEMARRQSVAESTPELLRTTVQAASECVLKAREHSGSVVGSLLILHVARRMVFAVMKHQYTNPNELEEKLSELRAIENIFREEIQVVEGLPPGGMSKGGEA